MEQEKIKAYYQMWSEAWKYFRKWLYDLRNDDEYWRTCIKDADDFCNQYKGSPQEKVAKSIIMDILEELERLERGSE